MSQRAHLIEDRQRDYDRTEESRGNRDLKTWTKGMEIKKEFHQTLFGDIKSPEPLEFSVKAIESNNIPKDKIQNPASQRSYTPSI